MLICAATNNQGKLKELRRILEAQGHEVKSLKELDIHIDPEENGETFAENAFIKAEAICKACGFATVADDSGLCVDALSGAPGVYSARFALDGHNDEANNEKLLRLMKDIPDDKRTCRFVCSMALVRPECETVTATGYAEGMLLREKRGENGFGYDPLFYCEKFGCSFAELTSDEKNSISHRRRALEGILEQI